MSVRDDVHQLVDRIPEVHLASIRAYLAKFAPKPWDAYFADLPVGDESFTEEERASLTAQPAPESELVSLEDLRRELEHHQ
jgi:hypothetical protein